VPTPVVRLHACGHVGGVTGCREDGRADSRVDSLRTRVAGHGRADPVSEEPLRDDALAARITADPEATDLAIQLLAKLPETR
jgi:hypothetical protein